MRYRFFIHGFLLQSRKRWVRRWKRRWLPISMAVRVATEAWPPHQFSCSTLFSAGPSCEQPWHTCQDSDSDTADTRGIFVVIRPLRLHLAWFPSPTHVTSEGSLPFSTRLKGPATSDLLRRLCWCLCSVFMYGNSKSVFVRYSIASCVTSLQKL